MERSGSTSDDLDDEISLGGSPAPVAVQEPASASASRTSRPAKRAETAGDMLPPTAGTPTGGDPTAQAHALAKAASALDVNGLAQILERRSAEATLLAESFRDPGAPFVGICRFSTRAKCLSSQPGVACSAAHFIVRPLPQTEQSLGECSYLNTCHHLDTCRYVHYELETPSPAQADDMAARREKQAASRVPRDRMLPPQWLDADLRKLDATVLGKFDVIMADPPWDIHMSLPYGTMTDEEMRAMPLAQLQDDGGLLFLWVTGRATELGRECLKVWGYQTLDEIVWVKTNQVGALVRTGRTGHWLNHSKEHCIVAYKKPAVSSTALASGGSGGGGGGALDACLSWPNRGVDVDVIVSEVRETSRKPDEIYSIIERLAPGPGRRRLELFGRKHNTRSGWLTLGNQLGDSCVYEQDVVDRLNKRYPSAPLEAAVLPDGYWDAQ